MLVYFSSSNEHYYSHIDECTGSSDWSEILSTSNSYPQHQQRHNFDPDWKQTFSVTLSFADGAAARTHAIQSALRPYRPSYFHFWQLKTFWHESKIW
jgi:hypothetical protein